MNKLLSIIDAQMINPGMDIDYLYKEIGMSRTKLYQKIKAITGHLLASLYVRPDLEKPLRL